MEEMNGSERVAFLKKKSMARKKAMELDWSKDKMFSYGNKPGFWYLSIDKMKRNLLPVLVECGLDFKFDYGNLVKQEPIGSMSQHWVLECTATLTDIDTGYSESTVVLGEAGDSGDKALGKASTYALKTFLADTFMLIDGIDPDQGTEQSAGNRNFVPKTDKEQEDVKSKVFANGIAPATPVETPQKAPEQPVQATKKPVPPVPGLMKDSGDPTAKAEAPKTVVQAPKKPVPPVPSAPKAPVTVEQKPYQMPDRPLTPGELSAERLKAEKIADFTPSVPQQNMFDRIFAYYGSLGKKGEITPEFAEQLGKDRAEVGSNSEAIAFIRKYPVPDDFTME